MKTLKFPSACLSSSRVYSSISNANYESICLSRENLVYISTVVSMINFHQCCKCFQVAYYVELYLIQPAIETYSIPYTNMACHTHSSPIQAPVLDIIPWIDPIQIRFFRSLSPKLLLACKEKTKSYQCLYHTHYWNHLFQ